MGPVCVRKEWTLDHVPLTPTRSKYLQSECKSGRTEQGRRIGAALGAGPQSRELDVVDTLLDDLAGAHVSGLRARAAEHGGSLLWPKTWDDAFLVWFSAAARSARS